VLCREHGQQLTALAAEYNNNNNVVVAFWGTVKETGVDDVGLYDFYHSYYTFPLFRDVELQLYTKAFGSRKIGLSTWNPLRLWRGYQEMGNRMTEKKIDGNLKGEGMIQGGVLVFGASGAIEYMYEENVGDPLEMDDIRAAVNVVLSSSSSSTTAESSSTTTKEL
jgi:AhpC/TSA antioxidant enzyme